MLNAAPATPAAVNPGNTSANGDPSRPSSMSSATRSSISARRASTLGPAPSASTNTTFASAGSRSRLASNTIRAARTRSTQVAERRMPRPKARPEPARSSVLAPFSALRSQLQRERERERCTGDAGASTYGALSGHADPHHICPQRTHANTTPIHNDPALSLYIPCKRLTSILKGPTQTRSMFTCPSSGAPIYQQTIIRNPHSLQASTTPPPKTALESHIPGSPQRVHLTNRGTK
jgi:hypothetical protein